MNFTQIPPLAFANAQNVAGILALFGERRGTDCSFFTSNQAPRIAAHGLRFGTRVVASRHRRRHHFIHLRHKPVACDSHDAAPSCVQELRRGPRGRPCSGAARRAWLLVEARRRP